MVKNKSLPFPKRQCRFLFILPNLFDSLSSLSLSFRDRPNELLKFSLFKMLHRTPTCVWNSEKLSEFGKTFLLKCLIAAKIQPHFHYSLPATHSVIYQPLIIQTLFHFPRHRFQMLSKIITNKFRDKQSSLLYCIS